MRAPPSLQRYRPRLHGPRPCPTSPTWRWRGRGDVWPHGDGAPLWGIELTDRTHLMVCSGSSAGSAAEEDVLYAPCRSLLLGYASHPAQLSLTSCHTLLFDALSAGPDMLQQRTMPNPSKGFLAETQGRCVDAVSELLRHYRADVQRVLALPLAQRRLLDDLRLVQLVASAGPNTAVLVGEELRPGRELSPDVACSLLSVPCAPAVLRVIVVHLLSTQTPPIDAQLFQRCAHALLSNDNFFTERTFAAMHDLLRSVLLPAVRHDAARGAAFSFTAVRWSTLMNRWSRVYAKAGRGLDLLDCLHTLVRTVPAVETKLPASVYVRVLGAVLDSAAAAETEAATQAGWEHMKTVAGDAVRLFGRNPAELRAVWVLLLKGALTLAPASEDHRRLLEAHHLCAERGHAVAVDRQAFLQLLRLVTAAVGTLPLAAASDVVSAVCRFMREQMSLSFLWLLDGVGTLLTQLWQSHGLAAQGEAGLLLGEMAALLRERRVTGVELHSNPVIARALERFEIGGAAAFWWTCGCGETLPCTSKRCTACLRKSAASWVCRQCRAVHKTACRTQSCACGCPNPRLAAAVDAARAICGQCGLVTAPGGACEACERRHQESESDVECAGCHATYQANGLHCPQCFTMNPEKQLYLWHCASCRDLNYSIWSSCRTCKAPRKTGALCMHFLPWRCGCGALNHPCRLMCGACGTGAHDHTYTCPGCDARPSVHSLQRVPLTVGERMLSLHLCPHCQRPHPRDDVVLHASSLTRHCMLCAHPVRPSGASATGAVVHCGVPQRVNENYVFRCTHCNHAELQTGYHCRHCLFPRPEVEALLVDDGADAAPMEHHVWRCLQEAADDDDNGGGGGGGALCGQWNYGWSAHCIACGRGRPDSPAECRAKAHMWTCAVCHTPNRPIDVLVCPHCNAGLQPAQACATCGLPHLSYACRTHV
ncbi:hypothetical protein NESM_000399500 [Novymonas esmeraldas]|uniref:RanBP2-type domain-containing protein n=1 Tax=Novymonas esmeraldas TaxID=1808958 RepID=A0AAW0EMA8_9TRYP